MRGLCVYGTGQRGFVEQIEEMNAEYVLEYGEEIGLGDCAYTIISIDD